MTQVLGLRIRGMQTRTLSLVELIAPPATAENKLAQAMPPDLKTGARKVVEV